MSARTPIHKAPHTDAAADARRATPANRDKRRSLSWVRDVLSRSIGLAQRHNQLHVVLVDAKRGLADQPSSLLLQQRAELGARLLVHDPLTQTVRNLFVVHDELGRNGWPAVAALPAPVTARALAEAEMLASQEPSALLATIIEALRELNAAADRRAEHKAVQRAEQELLLRGWEAPAVPEVSEATHEEYDLMERSWIGTVPSGLELPGRGT